MANYYYNGVELPALPEWDKAQYPYAYIFYVTSTLTGEALEWYEAVFSSNPRYDYSTSGKYCIGYRAGDRHKSTTFDCTEWRDGFGTYERDGLSVELDENLIWSNFDILNEDGSVFLPASEPVPVGAITPVGADLYVKKGNKVYKASGGGAGGGTQIHTFNSVEEMNAANLADGSIACVPSVETVFDISESVNYAKSIMAGGAVQQAFSVEACPQIVEALKKGVVKIKVSISAGVTIEEFVTGSINEAGNARVTSFTIYNGDLLYTDTFFDHVNKRIDYICKQVTTAIYNPS